MSRKSPTVSAASPPLPSAITIRSSTSPAASTRTPSTATGATTTGTAAPGSSRRRYGLYPTPSATSPPERATSTISNRIDPDRSSWPTGLGAEQISYNNSISYPDFVLQTAWPNAWEAWALSWTQRKRSSIMTPREPENELPSQAAQRVDDDDFQQRHPRTPAEREAPSGRCHRQREHRSHQQKVCSRTRSLCGFALSVRHSCACSDQRRGLRRLATVCRSRSPTTPPSAPVSVDTSSTRAPRQHHVRRGLLTGCPADLNGDGFCRLTRFLLFAAAYDLLDCADPGMPADVERL